jgi:hypothetical protein
MTLLSLSPAYAIPETLTTWLLGGPDVKTCPSLRTSVQPASTAFCETRFPEGLNIRMRFFIHIIYKVL